MDKNKINGVGSNQINDRKKGVRYSTDYNWTEAIKLEMKTIFSRKRGAAILDRIQSEMTTLFCLTYHTK